MSLNEEILKAVNAGLPAVMAGELKTFITDSENALSELVALRETNKQHLIELTKLRGIESKENSLVGRESAVSSRERKMDIDEAVFKAKSESEGQRLAEIRGLVNTVFQSNRMNYNLNLGIPVKDQYGNLTQHSVGGNISKDAG